MSAVFSLFSSFHTSYGHRIITQFHNARVMDRDLVYPLSDVFLLVTLVFLNTLDNQPAKTSVKNRLLCQGRQWRTATTPRLHTKSLLGFLARFHTPSALLYDGFVHGVIHAPASLVRTMNFIAAWRSCSELRNRCFWPTQMHKKTQRTGTASSQKTAVTHTLFSGDPS